MCVCQTARAEQIVLCVSVEALGTISTGPIKQPTDTENVCAKILNKGNDLKSSGMGSQKY